MVDVDKIFFTLVMLFCYGCNLTDTQHPIDLLYQNKFDTAAIYFDNRELNFVFEKNLQFEHKYTFFIKEDQFVITEVDGKPIDPDTIMFKYIEKNGIVKFGNKSLVKMFKYEVSTSIQLALYNKAMNRINRAYDWQIQTEDIELNYEIGKIFFDEYELELAYPYLQKAFNGGNQSAGLLLSDIHTLSGNREKGISLLKSMAKSSNADAMVKLGELYDTYSSVLGYIPPDDAKDVSSYEWYKKAARLNNAVAMQRIGYIYKAGINREMNLDSAIFWFQESSRLGEASATVDLALIRILSGNLEIGLKLMDQAIEQNDQLGFFEYGKIYEFGIGVAIDKNLALRYYEMADSLGSQVAHIRIDILQKEMREM